MTRSTVIAIAAISACFVWQGNVMAGNATVLAHVQSVMVTADSTFGGCMAKLSVDPSAELPGCNRGWVTFSCTGDFADPVRAYRLLDQAQLALAARKQFRVYFTDDQKHNGFCFVYRADVLQ